MERIGGHCRATFWKYSCTLLIDFLWCALSVPQKCQRFYIYIYLLFFIHLPTDIWHHVTLDWNHLVFVLLKSSCFFWLHSGHMCCLCALILCMYWTLLSLCVCVGAILWYRQVIFRPRPVFMQFIGSRKKVLIWKVSDTLHWCVCVRVCVIIIMDTGCKRVQIP